jgi:hypothetical protein
LAKDGRQEITVFVVWSSQLGAKEEHLPGAMELMPDPRARHYWDPSDQIGRAYQSRLPDPSADGAAFKLKTAAWDVWMLFDREVSWDQGGVPLPGWWEHQLRELPQELRLDPERFAQKAAEFPERAPSDPR